MKNKIQKIITWLLEGNLSRRLSDKHFSIFMYFITKRKFLNLNNPTTYTEKLQWIKLYGGLDRFWKYVDKYEVREIIKKTIGDKYLIPLFGVWNKAEDIPFIDLPNQFVLKATHGSKQIFVCRDKSKVDVETINKKASGWLKEDFYKKTREVQYRDCIPRIVCEKYMEDETGGLVDYKIFCFSGKPQMIQVVSDRHVDKIGNYTFMDTNWNKLPIIYKGFPPKIDKIVNKPRKLKEMMEIATLLSKDFPFVRVDLYYVDKRVYFGELTFTPSNGTEKFDPETVDKDLGDLIKLIKK